MSTKAWAAIHPKFNEAEVKRLGPTSGGVYALWYKTGRWGCYYVGKADNVQKRLLEHLSDKEENPCIKKKRGSKCVFDWMLILTENEKSGAEKYLYDKLQPECNETDPGGIPVTVPLPPEPSNADPESVAMFG
jgi:excinuclease UvrABC nuclease subunit